MTGDERLAKVASVIHHAAERCVHPEYADAPCERWADALEPLLEEFRAEDEARALGAVKAVLDDSCHHCGSGPDRDGDHSCPCPSTDSECLAHLEYPVLPTNLRAALAAAEPDAGER